jgi:hypothetical protein
MVLRCCCWPCCKQFGGDTSSAAASLGGSGSSSRKALRLHPLLEGQEQQLDYDSQLQSPTARQLAAMLQPGATYDGEAAAAAAAQRHARSAPTSPDGHRVPNRSSSAHVRASVACDSARSPVLQVMSAAEEQHVCRALACV